MEKQYDDEVEIDLLELLYEFKKKLWLIILALAAGAGIAGVFSAVVMKPVYTSTSMLYVLSKETTLTSLADLQIGTQLTQDYKVLITSRPVLETVIDNLGLNQTYGQLKNRVSIANATDTRILTVSVTDNDPVMAKTITDSITQRASEYLGDIMEMTPPKIIELGQVPASPTSPGVKKNAAIGGIAGAFIVCGVITLYTVMNDTVRSEDDVAKYLGMPTLAVVPRRDKKNGGRTGKKEK